MRACQLKVSFSGRWVDIRIGRSHEQLKLEMTPQFAVNVTHKKAASEKVHDVTRAWWRLGQIGFFISFSLPLSLFCVLSTIKARQKKDLSAGLRIRLKGSFVVADRVIWLGGRDTRGRAEGHVALRWGLREEEGGRRGGGRGIGRRWRKGRGRAGGENRKWRCRRRGRRKRK